MKKFILLLIFPFLSFGQGGDTNGDGFTNLEDLFNVLDDWLQNVNDNDPEAISNLDEMTNLVDSLITLNQSVNYGISIEGWVEHNYQFTNCCDSSLGGGACENNENNYYSVIDCADFPIINTAEKSGLLLIHQHMFCHTLNVYVNDDLIVQDYGAFGEPEVHKILTVPIKKGDEFILTQSCASYNLWNNNGTPQRLDFFSFGDVNVPHTNQSNSNNQNSLIPFSNQQDNITNGELWTWTPNLPEYPCSECPTWDWGSTPDDIVFDQLDSDLYVVPEGKILKITSTNFENVNATVFRDGEEFSLNYAECVQTLTCTSPCASWSPTLNDLSHMTLMEGDTLLLSPIVYASSINVYGDYGLLEGIQPVNAQTLFGYIEDMGANTPIYKRIVPSSPTYTVPDGKRLVIQYFYAYGTEGETLNIEAEDFNGDYSYSILNEIPLLSNTTITINFSSSENFCQNHFLLSGYLVNDE